MSIARLNADPSIEQSSRVEEREAAVAVLLCTYNGEPFLEEQLESILSQDHRNLHLWVSDDGSSDGTMSILRRYQSRLGADRFVIIEGPRNGFAANFLTLLCAPEIDADYYMFADQDDIWEGTKISCALKAMACEPSNAPLVYSSRTTLVDINNVEIGLSPLFFRPASFRNAIIQSIGGGNTMVVNRAARDLARRANVQTIISHDWWLYMLVTGAGGKMIYDSVPRVRYRQHGSNLIGMNVGWKMKLQRLRRLASGQFREWNNVNMRALQANSHLLTPENRSVLNAFLDARDGGLLRRVVGLRRSGAYRQTFGDEVVVLLATILNKI
ncbi:MULTISPECIES: glycosyltransferase family 2 protein [unclassified Rhizobium]|uniref:glycosyltransferase family 2 protein n=1 Tax=unclassified Rhizobium TaxID=2613769 RepID=UPI001ADA266F|nr:MULTISPECIES: glycosyltransferase family 2 protein [unclassified Rhizobium]MBO9127829.1 glycosyltransferase family 2 protein [Rhizobium sp. 16-488-2b]MBO9176947.1 glycosyltransferase family 2 protein [Rhizobium sp. 16-488-2a]